MKKKFIFTIVLIIVLFAAIIYCIRPVEKFNDTSTEQVSLKEIMKEKMLDSITGMLNNSSKEFQFELSEKDMNNIIFMNMDKLKSKKIDSVHCTIHNGEVYFYADTKLFSLFSAQLILKTDLTVADNTLQVKINKAYIGRIPVIKSLITDNLKNKIDKVNIDEETSVISIPITMPEAVTIEDFQTTDRINFKVAISIKSLSDIIEIVEYFGGKLMK